VSWKTPVTLVVLLGVLLGAAYYGWRTIISPATSDATQQTHRDGPKCTKKQAYHKGQTIKAKDIIVNVYNAGAIAGLADQTLTTLANKGFRSGVADNAPGGVSATNVTILTSDKQSPQVQLVAHQFKGKVVISKGPPLAAGIDVIVGDSFAGTKDGAKVYLTLHHSITTCTSQKRSH
jgi:LytR cell envelope-related transcriptional attenuator